MTPTSAWKGNRALTSHPNPANNSLPHQNDVSPSRSTPCHPRECRAQFYFLKARTTRLSASPVATTNGVVTASSEMMFGSNRRPSP